MVRLDRAKHMINLNDEQIKQMIDFMKKREEIQAFFLFVSYGTKYQTRLSDVDFAILPYSKEDSIIHLEAEILPELQKIGKSDDINLVNLFKVPVTLQMRILTDGNLLFCRNEILLANFKEMVIRNYCDFEPDLKAFYHDYDAALREEYLYDS